MQLTKASKARVQFCLLTTSISCCATFLLLREVSVSADAPTTRVAILSGIQYAQADRHFRMVLDLSEARPFTLGKLDSPGFYLEIHNTRLSTDFHANSPQLPSNSLIQVKAHQLGKDKTRVVFQVDSVANLRVFPLKKPSRIVIQIDLPSVSTPVGENRQSASRDLGDTADLTLPESGKQQYQLGKGVALDIPFW